MCSACFSLGLKDLGGVLSVIGVHVKRVWAGLTSEKAGDSNVHDLLSFWALRLQCGTRSTLVEQGYPGCSCDNSWHYFSY